MKPTYGLPGRRLARAVLPATAAVAIGTAAFAEMPLDPDALDRVTAGSGSAVSSSSYASAAGSGNTTDTTASGLVYKSTIVASTTADGSGATATLTASTVLVSTGGRTGVSGARGSTGGGQSSSEASRFGTTGYLATQASAFSQGRDARSSAAAGRNGGQPQGTTETSLSVQLTTSRTSYASAHYSTRW